MESLVKEFKNNNYFKDGIEQLLGGLDLTDEKPTVINDQFYLSKFKLK